MQISNFMKICPVGDELFHAAPYFLNDGLGTILTLYTGKTFRESRVYQSCPVICARNNRQWTTTTFTPAPPSSNHRHMGIRYVL